MRGRRTAGRAVSYLRLGVMPRLFVYTSSGTPPNGLAYKPASKSALLNEDEKRINRYIVKIHQWQGKLAKTSRELAMNIQSAIVEAEKAYKGNAAQRVGSLPKWAVSSC